MSRNYLDDEKLKYENIEIPEELDFMVRNTLKEGRIKRNLNKAYKYASGIACTFLVFIILVNAFPAVAYAMSKIPGLDKLIELITFDKSFDNAIEEGLVEKINFEEEKNGVKLKVNTIAGDFKRIWIGYEISSEVNYGIHVNILRRESMEPVSMVLQSSFNNVQSEMNGDEHYLEIGLNEFIDEFILEFNIYDKENEEESILNEEYVTTFSVPIELKEEIFNSKLREVKLDNNIINTEIGDIEIVSLKTCKTRTVIEFKLNSDIYDYMNFKNPRLIDNKGNEYKISSFFGTSTEYSNNSFLELQGEIKDNIKNLKFSFDEMYYAGKDNRNIVVNLKDKIVEANEYNFEFVSFIGNELILKGDGVESVSFEDTITENGELLVSDNGVSCIGTDEDEDFYVKSYFKLNDITVDRVEVKIFWIMKDKVKGTSVELIK